MKTLEQRFSRIFSAADLAAARAIAPASVSCPRVGQVHGTVVAADGTHEVHLELAAHRKGGMTLEARCTSPAGRVGRPCAALAAVLLEIDRRGLLAGIPAQTPVALDIVADDAPDEVTATTDSEEEAGGRGITGGTGRQSRVEPATVAAVPRGVPRPGSPSSRSGAGWSSPRSAPPRSTFPTRGGRQARSSSCSTSRPPRTLGR